MNGAGNLEVMTTGPGACDNGGLGPNCWGAARYDTPDSLRNDPDHAVSVSFIDAGPGTHGMQIWATKEDPPSSWTQFGARNGDTHYYILLLRFDPVFELRTIELNVERTAGVHTLTIGKRADNTVDYFIDGDLVYSDAFMQLGYIGDVYLATASTITSPVTGIFTAYSTSNNYVGPVPPICVNPYTGQMQVGTYCASPGIAVKLPFHAPLTLCVNYWSGSTRAIFYGACGAAELTVVAVGDQSVSGCVSYYSGKLRIPFMPGTCRSSEMAVFI